MNYAFVHGGRTYGPDGPIKDSKGKPLEAKDAANYNKALEAKQVEYLKTGPERELLFVRLDGSPPRVTTWLGTDVATNVVVGAKSMTGFQGACKGGTYRRSISCRIFGVLYHGWYYESSGDYCRLKKAKRQTRKE